MISCVYLQNEEPKYRECRMVYKKDTDKNDFEEYYPDKKGEDEENVVRRHV